MLYTLAYTSEAFKRLDRYELLDILVHARGKNRRLKITGLLLYSNKKFIQVLEGEKETVLSLYKQIQDDPLHFNVTTVLEKDINERVFPDWTMGYKNIAPVSYKEIPGIKLVIDNDKAARPYDVLIHFRHDDSCFRSHSVI